MFHAIISSTFCCKNAGTDDDLPSSHQNRISIGGRVPVNRQSAVGATAYPRMYTDMEAQIHLLEQEAYSAVLRAFKAQSDAISWVFTLYFNLQNLFFSHHILIVCKVSSSGQGDFNNRT